MNATEILSDEHRELLDVIDSLRSQNFSRYVDLPQIIVCGDQSAGKSSVLEAISSMRFPTKDGLCTRFATELVLRRGSEKSPKVSILPGGDRYGDEKNQIAEWTPAASIEADGLEAVTEEAKQRMATPEPKRFYNDILRIEVTGPTQPHLTMVDLPGLFRAGNSEQSDKDGEIVRDMVESYMARPRSIILAVVSAKNGYVLQEVTEMAKKADPEGRRTIGLITKPDTLDVGSDSETSYVKLAQNNDVKLRLGWHVLRNRNFEERNSSSDQRDKVEDEFFSHGIWADLNPSYCGVRALKDRLSSVLKDQIIEQLPSLVEDVEEGIRDCSTKLERLGPVRTTVTEKRRYLTQISDSYTFLMTQAVEGNYSHPFFGSSKRIEMYSRRLRAVVQNLLIDFAKSMHHSGKSQIIYEFEDESGARAGSDSTPIARSTYLENVTERLRHSRGRELPELFNPLIVGDLFLEQCKAWRSIASQLVEDILTVVKRTVEQLVDYIVPGDVAEGILRYLSDVIERLEVELASKIEAVIPLETSHPISYNDELGGLIRKAQLDRHKRALQKVMEETFGSKLQNPEAKISCNPLKLLETLLLKFETDMKDYGSSTAADAMEAYYKIALVRFIDDVSVLGIEHCLVAKLPTLMRPTDVLDMSDSELSRLASESPKSSRERTHLAQKRETLEKGLPVLKAFQSRRQNTFIIPVLVTEQPPSTIDQNSDAQSVGGQSVSAHSAATESSEEPVPFGGSLEQLQEDHIRSSRPYSMSPQLSKLAINGFQD